MDRKQIVMFHPYINAQAAVNVMDTLTQRHEDGRLWVGEGPKVKQFEQCIRDKFGVEYCVALNSGTAALELALALAGVEWGDEVISVAQTCTATNMPILRAGADVVFADIQYETGNMDPTDIQHRITERTKAVMCVHWAGYPCDMHALEKLCAKWNLALIADGAHALGAKYRGQPIMSCADYTMISFQAIKQLTCGDGGLLAMTEEAKYHEARRRRWFGIDRVNREPRLDGYSYWDQTEVGYKMHMNDISAAIGLGNLTEIDQLLRHRAFIAAAYRKSLADVPGVTLFEKKDDRTSGNWLFTMHVENRDDFCRMMRDKSIEVSVVHIRNDVHGVFGPRRDDLPNTDRYEQTAISIPLHNHLEVDDVEYIIECVEGGW